MTVDPEVYLSFDETPVDEYDPAEDGDNTELIPDATPDRKLSSAHTKKATPKTPKLVVPHPRDLRDGTKPSIGWDVYALQRALSVAHLRRWGTFTRVYGPGTRAEVRKFQQTHGLHVDGVYGPATHKKLAPYYDSYGIHLINQVHVQTPAEHKRAILLSAAQVLYNRGQVIHYTQGSARMWIVRHRYTLANLQVMSQCWEDCSSGVTGCYYVAGLPDPNGFGYNGQGYTGSLADHGAGIQEGQATVGCLYFYGRFPYSHVTMNVGRDRAWSQGREYGPDLVSPTYRPVSQTRKYGGLP